MTTRIRILVDGMPMQKQPAGVGYVIFNLLEKLSQHNDLEFVVYTRKGINKPSDLGLKPNNIIIHETNYRFSYFGLSRFIFEQKELPKIINQYKPNILHLTNSFGYPIFCYKNNEKLKVVLTIHDLIPLTQYWELMSEFDRLLYKISIKISISRADSIVAISKFTVNDLKRHFPDIKNISVAANGIGPIKTPDNLNKLWEDVKIKYQINENYIFYLGGFAPRKNILRLLQAYYLLQKANKINWQLIISGRFSSAPDIKKNLIQIQQYINNNDLKRHIILIDYLSRDEKIVFLSKARFFVYPSLYEGFGLPVLEAFSVGTPVLTSKNSPMEEIAGKYSLYCNPNNIESIAEKIFEMLTNYPLYKKLACEAKIELIPQFNWQKTGDHYYNLYLKLCNQKYRS